MTPTVVLLLAFAIGVVTGLRSLTAPAAVSWAAHFKWLHLHGSLLAFLAYTPAAILFTLGALFELVVDKLPSTPSRTAPPGLIARFLLGALSGAAVSTSGGQSLALGAILGAAAGIAGAFAGYQVRTRLVKALHVPDIVIALAEDALAICAAFFIVSRS